MTNGKERTEKGLTIMFKILKNYNFEQIKQAVYHHLKNSQFKITIADINKFLEISDKENIELKARNAFRRIIRAIGKHSSNEMGFGRLKIHFALQSIGGLFRVCNSQVTEQVWIEKEFIQAYQVAESRNLTWNTLPKYFRTPHSQKNVNKKQILIDLFEPEKKALTTAKSFNPEKSIVSGEKRIDFTNSLEFKKFVKGLGA